MTRENELSLFLDTATKNLSLTLTSSKHFYRVDLGDPKKVLERLHLGIEMALSAFSASFADIRSYYALLGPGSNTGIRLGLSVAKTVKGIDPSVRLYGIGTLELLLLAKEGASAVLSDRKGDLYLAQKDGQGLQERKVPKEEIPSLAGSFVVDRCDREALASLEGKDVHPVDVLDLMVEKKSAFADMSDNPKEYRPHYAFEI